MLQTRPLDFNPLLGQVAKLKHYPAAISFLSVLAKLFKFGFEPDVATYSTLIKGFVIEDRISEAAALFCKLLEETSRAVGLVQEMVERGFSADDSTMKWVVDLLSKDKLDPELVERNSYFQLFDTMLKP
ncbi:hypothetical protein L3X38_036218 [Prunus dulcis]|uniref:Pentatricopeptide repeat-containing protein n=1 Tax=Prunus dulcis TaxID=3755 RepID=A0AAD4V2F3_PRUDU|nr:hypothetical protein L3X38_036218 [Prunus dulcis]